MIRAAGNSDRAAVEQSLAFFNQWEVGKRRNDADDNGKDSDNGSNPTNDVNNFLQTKDTDEKNQTNEEKKTKPHGNTPLLIHRGCSTGRHEEEAAEREQPCHGFANLAEDRSGIECSDFIEVTQIAGTSGIGICGIGDKDHKEVKRRNRKRTPDTVSGKILHCFLSGSKTGANKECHQGADKDKYSAPT